jgi:hypothetical protein
VEDIVTSPNHFDRRSTFLLADSFTLEVQERFGYSQQLCQGNLEDTERVDLTDTEVNRERSRRTSDRLNPGCAIDFSRSRKEREAILKLLDRRVLHPGFA